MINMHVVHVPNYDQEAFLWMYAHLPLTQSTGKHLLVSILPADNSRNNDSSETAIEGGKQKIVTGCIS